MRSQRASVSMSGVGVGVPAPGYAYGGGGPGPYGYETGYAGGYGYATMEPAHGDTDTAGGAKVERRLSKRQMEKSREGSGAAGGNAVRCFSLLDWSTLSFYSESTFSCRRLRRLSSCAIMACQLHRLRTHHLHLHTREEARLRNRPCGRRPIRPRIIRALSQARALGLSSPPPSPPSLPARTSSVQVARRAS